MYKLLVFNLTIGASAFSFWEEVMTDRPKCLDFVYSPCNILLYLIKTLSSAQSSITNKQLYNLFILFFFWYSITLCCVSMMCAKLSGSYSSNKYCSFVLSIFSSFSMYRITCLYASSMCAVGDTMYILSKHPLKIFRMRFWINIPLPPFEALTIIDRNGSLSACGYGLCLNSYCFTLIGSILGTATELLLRPSVGTSSFFHIIYLEMNF